MTMTSPILITSEPCAPYETHWYTACLSQGLFQMYVWRNAHNHTTYPTTQPPVPPGMRGYGWCPERDDLESQTCTARLPFTLAWWWRRRWACALNAYGKRCDVRPPCRWLELHKWRQTHITPNRCIVETCRPGTRETSLDSASCAV